MFALGVITDEVSQNLRVAAEFAVRYGMTTLDLRSVENKSPFEMTREDYLRARDTAAEFGLSVAAIDAPLFKCSLGDTAAVSEHLRQLERLVPIAREIGCGIIRGFDFWDEGYAVERRAEILRRAAGLLEGSDVVFALESDPSVHASTPIKARELLDTVDSPCVQALFDPGNGFFADPADEPYPRDYELLRGRICHVHIKDARVLPSGTEAVAVGAGLVSYVPLLRALIRDGYAGSVALETHYRKKTAMTEEQLRLPGGSDFSDGAAEASAESAEALIRLLEQAKKTI